MRGKTVILVTAFFVAMVLVCGTAKGQVKFGFAAAITAPGQCLMAHPGATRSVGIAVNLQADASCLRLLTQLIPVGHQITPRR